MKTKIAMLLTIGVLLSAASYAQRVGTGSCEIDCTGMKGVSITKKGFVNTSDDKTSSEKSDEYTSNAANQQIYYKFEVTPKDVNIDPNGGAMKWSNALLACRNYGDGQSWRLPTYREMILILVLNPELVKAGNYTSLAIDINFAYWSATNYGNTEVWSVGTFLGPTGKDRTIKEKPTDPDNSPNRIRCIKELK